MVIKKIVLLIFIFFSGLIISQTREELERRNAALKAEINNLNKQLQQSKSESKSSITYITQLNNKINAREQLYNNMFKEKRFIEDDI